MGANLQDQRFLLQELLRDVSRSFYLTLRILPRQIRGQIGLAYLLARASDTIADTEAIGVNDRLSALRALRERFMGSETAPLNLPEIQANQSLPAERVLLERINDALALLHRLSPADLILVRKVLDVITSGQELDLLRFGSGSAKSIRCLASAEELDDYTYRVAGCVGEFWTHICVAHLAPKPRLALDPLVKKGVRFGQGLQLVNILRDFPRDLRNGRCYLPASELRSAGLEPHDLLDATKEQQFRAAYNPWLQKAEDHLDVAWSYVQELPRSWIRLRLACAWPVLIGMATTRRLWNENVLKSDTRIKVPRSEIGSILRRSVLFYPFPGRWNTLPVKTRRAGLS